MTVQDAIDFFGCKARIARALGISKTAVGSWEKVPPLRQLQLERITRGKLKADADALNPVAHSENQPAA